MYDPSDDGKMPYKKKAKKKAPKKRGCPANNYGPHQHEWVTVTNSGSYRTWKSLSGVDITMWLDSMSDTDYMRKFCIGCGASPSRAWRNKPLNTYAVMKRRDLEDLRIKYETY